MIKFYAILIFLLLFTFPDALAQLNTAQTKLDSLQQLLHQKSELDRHAFIYNRMSEVAYESGTLEVALQYAQKANAIAQKNEEVAELGLSYTLIANYYSAQSNYQKASEYLELSLEQYKKTDDLWRIAYTAYQLGTNYAVISYNDQALESFYLSLAYYQKNKQAEGIVMCYAEIGHLYSKTSEHQLAPNYYKKGIALAKKHGYETLEITLLESLGVHYYRHSDYKMGLKYLLEAAKLAQTKPEYELRLANTYVYLGEIKTKQKEFDAAMNYLRFSLNIYTKHQYEVGKIAVDRRLAFLYFDLKQYALAELHIQKSIVHHLKTKEKNPLFDDYRLLYLIHEAKGNHQLALKNHVLYKSYLDSLNMDDASKNAIKFESSKKEAELRAQQQEVLYQKSIQTNTTYSILGTTLLLSIIGMYTYWIRNKKLRLEKQNLDLRRRDAELAKDTEEFKARFLSNISHEFRTPLTLINGHLEILLQEGNSKNIKRYKEMQHSGNRLLQLINQLLDLAKLETGKYSLYYKAGALLNELQVCIDSFHSLAEERKITLTTTISFAARVKFAQQNFSYSSEALDSILSNLISNALKFTPKGGEVHVSVDYIGNRLYIAVRDSGQGIPSDELTHIFDRFYQSKQNNEPIYEGSGIGLSVVKELAYFHGGDAEVINNPEGGCTFTVWIAEGHNTTQVVAETKQQPLEVAVLNYETPEVVALATNDSQKPVILVVEDQRELRKFIVENIGSQYFVLEASNGKEGYEMALEHLPEIIISDVMMPEMDGFQMTKSIKTNMATSHISIILLTAKVAQSNIIEGLQYGADDYLSKPFSMAELQLRVKNRLRQLESIRHQWLETSSNLAVEETSTLNALDQEFIEKLKNIVIRNIENEVDVTILSKEIGLSNSQLTRKLKVLIGVTPANFIKNIQLNYALALLRDGYSVSETCWKSGYTDPAYFSKIFKKHFGFLPSEKEKLKN